MAEQENQVLEQVITSNPETQTEEKKPETTVAQEEKPETVEISKTSGEGGSTKLECTEENKNLSKSNYFL